MLGLALSVLLLLLLSVLVTRALEPFMPETPGGLVRLAAISALALWLIAALVFAGLYWLEDPRVLSTLGAPAGVLHMLTLGAQAALVWAPLSLLTVITAPRRWKTGTW